VETIWEGCVCEEDGAFGTRLAPAGNVRPKIMFSHDLRSEYGFRGGRAFVARPREERTKIFCWSI
jgi:hypothetical protein